MCAVNRRKEKSININKNELPVILVMMTGSLILVLWKLMGYIPILVLCNSRKFS